MVGDGILTVPSHSVSFGGQKELGSVNLVWLEVDLSKDGALKVHPLSAQMALDITEMSAKT